MCPPLVVFYNITCKQWFLANAPLYPPPPHGQKIQSFSPCDPAGANEQKQAQNKPK